jgi:hypothetical protein
LEKEYGKEYPLLIADSTTAVKQNGGNSSPLPMSTFGKDARHVYHRHYI